MNYAHFLLTVFLTVLGSGVCELQFCDDAYQQFLMYADVWKDVRSASESSTTHSIPEMYTAKYLEDYAKQICSVVAPQARNSFRTEVAQCHNVNQTLAVLEEPGGFCQGNTLNYRVKAAIIDRLRPVSNFITCMKINDYSNCYSSASSELKETRLLVSSFHDELDRFFDQIWDCQARLYKSHSGSCPNWQLPMLLSLDSMYVPVLFRVRLTDRQIAMLELDTDVTSTTPATSTTRASLKKGKKWKKKKKKGRKAKKVKLPKIKIGKTKKTKTSRPTTSRPTTSYKTSRPTTKRPTTSSKTGTSSQKKKSG
ncbi:unnamed protein product [Candidula unifasciata]|uniref:Uncharacterized protein n=1 Tax=Candidula unifasciata TaxID=100452 RepID=A0A8S3ZDN0_9EUPU|nr:unnamed protein product [Candidula unifasciata]